MIVYTDKNTGKELFTNSYDHKEIDDIIIEVTGKHTTMKLVDGNIDIGANASQEEAAEEVDDTASKSGVDVVIAHELKPLASPYSYADYCTYLKEYMKTLGLSDEEMGDYKKKMGRFVQKTFGKKGDKFGGFDQYLGDGSDILDKPMIILLNYSEEDDTPYLYFIKQGLVATKY